MPQNPTNQTKPIIKGVRAKTLEATLLLVDFSKAFNSIQKGKIEQIQFAFKKKKL